MVQVYCGLLFVPTPSPAFERAETRLAIGLPRLWNTFKPVEPPGLTPRFSTYLTGSHLCTERIDCFTPDPSARRHLVFTISLQSSFARAYLLAWSKRGKGCGPPA